MSRRVLAASLMHETDTFSRLATDLDAFRRRYDHRGDAIPAAFRGTRSEMGAFLDAAEAYGWTLAHPVAAAATPSGIVTRDAWAELSGALLAALDRKPDGILLALHGAMVTETAEDAEGDLLARIRDRVGCDVPIAVTLDLHANVTDRMAELANILIAYRAAYAPMAREVLVVDAGGLTTPDYRRFAYRKLRRPIWPLDEVAEP